MGINLPNLHLVDRKLNKKYKFHFFYVLFCLHSNNNFDFAPKTNIYHVKITGAKGIFYFYQPVLMIKCYII